MGVVAREVIELHTREAVRLETFLVLSALDLRACDLK